MVFHILLKDRNSENRRTVEVRTCESFKEAETKLLHDERYHFDPKFEEMIAIVKDDYVV